MFFRQERDDLRSAQTEAEPLLTGHHRPRILATENVSTFCDELRYACELIVEEKEIILFAVLQWVAIVAAYLLWTQVLDWIPDSVWQEVRRSSEREDNGAFTLMNLVLLGWSFLVIAAVSYPISLFSAAMVAAHYLRHSDHPSTVGHCLQLAYRNLGRLWVFTTIDAWITVSAILDRLPKKRGRRTAAEELLYYAWKIGTVGVLPALVAGKGYMEAAKDSVSLLRTDPTRTIGIRMGYSLVCWIIGITAYIGAIAYFSAYGEHNPQANEIYNFYFLMVVPILVAAGVTAVLVRPFFLVMTAQLYTDIVPFAKIDAASEPRGRNLLAFAFLAILAALVGLAAFGPSLGVTEWIESMAAKDIQQYRRANP